MSDDKSIRGSQDRSRIALDEAYEVDYWTGKFGCSKDQLLAAVDAVGSSADKVEKYLKERL